MDKERRLEIITQIVVWGLIALYVLFFSINSFLRYYSFDYDNMDLAAYNQIIWNIVHGSLESSILGINFLGHHAHFIYPDSLVSHGVFNLGDLPRPVFTTGLQPQPHHKRCLGYAAGAFYADDSAGGKRRVHIYVFTEAFFAGKRRSLEYIDEIEETVCAGEKQRMKTIVVLPAYNAAKTLTATYRDIPKDLVDDIILERKR